MRFKIRTKLLFAFIAILIPVVALTGIAFYNQKLLHRELTRIKAAASESEHFSDLHFKIHAALMPPHDYLLTGDKKARDIFKRDMGEVERLFNTIYEGGFCSQCHAFPKKQLDENLRGMREGIEKIRLKGEEIFRIEHPVGSREGLRLTEDMEAIAVGLITKQMSSYKEIHGKMLSKTLEESGRILNRYLVIMVFGHIVLIGLYFLLAYLSSGYIARPLEKLYKGAESIANRDFDYKLDIRTGDEIEQLAKEFNFMEEKLRGFYGELEDRVRERTEAIQQEKEKAQRYLDLAAVMFVAVNADQQVALINKKGCEVLGCDPGDIIGKNWFDNFIPERLRGEIRDMFNSLMEGILQNVEYHENPVLTRDGRERIIVWHNSILTDEKGKITGTLSAGEDVTERKKSEKQLFESELKFKIVTDKSPNMIFINARGRIVYVNRSCEEIMGYKKDELIHPDFDPWSLVAREYLDIANENLRKHMKGLDVGPQEYKLITKDGRFIDTIISTKLINYEGENAILGIVTDLSSQKQYEKELKKQIDELERYQKATVEREFRIRELRDRVKELEAETQDLKLKIQGLEKKDN